MRGGRLLAAGLACVAIAGAGLAVCRQVPGGSEPPLTRTERVSRWRYPPGATDEERQALIDHIHEGTPVPPGFTLLENLGEVTGTLTGIVDPATGERLITVTVADDVADLEEALASTWMVRSRPRRRAPTGASWIAWKQAARRPR